MPGRLDGDSPAPAPIDGALHTPRSAQAATFAAIVVGLGAAFMPQYFIALMFGCYILAILTLLLCWREIRQIYRRLRRNQKGASPCS
jgi:hypothetical protein